MKKLYWALISILAFISFSILLFNTSEPYNKNTELTQTNLYEKHPLSTNNSMDNEAILNDCELIRVVDGDTIEVTYNSKKEKVRLIGVNTPESVHPDETKNTEFGKISSEFTKNYLENKKIQLEFDVEERDKYGRLLAYVYADGIMLNITLLEEGYAQIATYPPNIRYVDYFKETQSLARENNEGLWAYDDSSETTQESTNVELVASKNSNKFHYSTCEWAKKISDDNKISFSSYDNAIKNNYEPCKVCNPK